jgi:hypothetical protein
MQGVSYYPDKLRLRVPRGLPAALERAARQQNTSPAEYARQALLRGLAADGVRLNDGRVEILDAEVSAAA